MPAEHELKVAINGDPLRPESLFASGSCPCGWGYGPTQSEAEVRAEYDRAHPAPAAADLLATALEEIRARAGWKSDGTRISGSWAAQAKSAKDVPRLLAAMEAVLEVHALTAFHRHTQPCDRHRHRGLADRPRCPDCKVIEWTGCETCRDEFGNPARAEDCTTRQAITRALLGEEAPE